MKAVIKTINHNFHAMALLKRVIAIWLAIELVAGLLILFVIPDHIVLKWYLPSQSVTSTQKFLGQEAFLVPDDITGWRNKPGINKETWVLDQFGSRPHKDVSLLKQKDKRLMFLGNSMINGGTHVSNQQTLSAYIEDENIDAINFGVMLYSLDQSFLLYKNYLKKFKPDLVIVGIDADPVSGLKNIYVPFRARDEVNMPYIKPKFTRQDDENINLIKPEIAQLQELWQQGWPDYIKKYDAFYQRYQAYQFGLLPAASLLGLAIRKYQSFKTYFIPDESGDELLLAVMQAFTDEIRQQGSDVLFVTMPSRSVVKPGRLRRLLPDLYAQKVALIQQADLPLLDSRVLFSQHKNDLGQYYAEDNSHFSAAGNRILAEYIKQHIQ